MGFAPVWVKELVSTMLRCSASDAIVKSKFVMPLVKLCPFVILMELIVPSKLLEIDTPVGAYYETTMENID
eukprot:scaffold998_cov213-Chaetoceros_neogracile.AAC.5